MHEWGIPEDLDEAMPKSNLTSALAVLANLVATYEGSPDDIRKEHREIQKKWEQSLKSAKEITFKTSEAIKKFHPVDNGRRVYRPNDAIVVGKFRLGYAVLDGNHRLITAYEKGEPTIKALVVDIPWAEDFDPISDMEHGYEPDMDEAGGGAGGPGGGLGSLMLPGRQKNYNVLGGLDHSKDVKEGELGEWGIPEAKQDTKIKVISRPKTRGDDLVIGAFKGPKQVGQLRVYDLGHRITASDVSVDKAFRRQGIATAMYVFAEKETGKKMVPADQAADKGFDPEDTFTDDARKLWNQPDRPFGEYVDPQLVVPDRMTGPKLEDEELDENTAALLSKWDSIAKRPNFVSWWIKNGEDVTDDFRFYGADDYPPFHEPFIKNREMDSNPYGIDVKIDRPAIKDWLSKEYKQVRSRVAKQLKSKGSNLILYRCIETEPKDINFEKIGTAWGMIPQAADCSYLGMSKGQELVLTAEIPVSEVDVDFSLAANLNPHTDENEIRVKTGTKILVTSIKDKVTGKEYLKEPKKASVGHGDFHV